MNEIQGLGFGDVVTTIVMWGFVVMFLLMNTERLKESGMLYPRFSFVMFVFGGVCLAALLAAAFVYGDGNHIRAITVTAAVTLMMTRGWDRYRRGRST